MLDKTLEFKGIIMRMEAHLVPTIKAAPLPEGFSYRFFRNPDDIKHWARIETSVLEFDDPKVAEEYFISSYLPQINDLRRRCVFIKNSDGLPIATATAWYANVSELGHQAILHWVGVCPEYQGLGLGKAVVQKVLEVFNELEAGYPIWLHTQTWSHPAVRLYHKLGFNFVKTDKLGNDNTRSGGSKIYEEDSMKAIEVLQKVVDKQLLDEYVRTAV